MANRLRWYMDSSNEPITERLLSMESLLVSVRSRAAWPSDWLPCHPARTNGGIRDRRFHFCTFPTDQRPRMSLATGNVRICAMHAAAMEFVP